MSAKKRTVYHASDGEYRRFVRFNRDAVIKSPHVQTGSDEKARIFYLDRDAPDYDSMFLSKGTAIPPDEIIQQKLTGFSVPLIPRHEFPADTPLPLSDLCKALHYYASTKYSKGAESKMSRSLDELALLAFAMLVEEWVDDVVDQDFVLSFLETVEPHRKTAINWNGLGEDDGDDGDENVLSTDMLSGEDVSDEDDVIGSSSDANDSE